MKLTRKYVRELQTLLKLTYQQTQKLQNTYCVNENELIGKVLYRYNISFRRGGDELGQGLITKKEYEFLQEEYERDPVIEYCNREISKHCYLRILFNEINFTDNIEDIEEYLANNERDENIFDGVFDGVEF
jgi:hypothetical protein